MNFHTATNTESAQRPIVVVRFATRLTGTNSLNWPPPILGTLADIIHEGTKRCTQPICLEKLVSRVRGSSNCLPILIIFALRVQSLTSNDKPTSGATQAV